MKKLNDLAKEINSLLKENPTIKEYLELKKQVESKKELQETTLKLDELRKDICKDKNRDSDEYFMLLDKYESDPLIKRYTQLKREINEYFVDISDILSLK